MDADGFMQSQNHIPWTLMGLFGVSVLLAKNVIGTTNPCDECALLYFGIDCFEARSFTIEI